MTANPKIKVVFIGGALRSGTTLLDVLLGQVDGVFSLGEVHYIWSGSFAENWLCGCGKPFKSCAFWQEVVRTAFGGFDQVEVQHVIKLQRAVARIRHTPQLLFPELRSSKFQALLNEYQSFLRQLYHAIYEVSGCQVLIDSSKVPSHALVLSEIPEIALNLIHVIRDSRAVVYSWQRKKRRPEIHWKEAYMPRLNLLKGVQDWMVLNGLTEMLRRNVHHYEVVRYETLTAHPKATIAHLLKKLDIASAPLSFFITDDQVHLQANHTVAGNPMRFKQGVLAIRPDQAWRKHMRFLPKLVVTSLTYPLLRRYRRIGTFSLEQEHTFDGGARTS